MQTELLLPDFVIERPHVADPSLIFDGLIGCDAIKARLAEYQAVVRAATAAGRDPIEDLGLTFAFQGSPGTGKTTVARRMGMLFESLGVLPSADVVQVSAPVVSGLPGSAYQTLHLHPSAAVAQVSASQLSTGFVGQTAATTRDIFESARGSVLFIDEACEEIALEIALVIALVIALEIALEIALHRRSL